jgi:hypothetical protein
MEEQFQRQLLPRFGGAEGLMLEPRLGATLECLRERETLLRAEIATLEQRRQRVWEIGEAGAVPASPAPRAEPRLIKQSVDLME